MIYTHIVSAKKTIQYTTVYIYIYIFFFFCNQQTNKEIYLCCIVVLSYVCFTKFLSILNYLQKFTKNLLLSLTTFVLIIVNNIVGE